MEFLPKKAWMLPSQQNELLILWPRLAPRNVNPESAQSCFQLNPVHKNQPAAIVLSKF